MANWFCYLRILIVKTAINQIFDKSLITSFQAEPEKLYYDRSYINGIGQISHSILSY